MIGSSTKILREEFKDHPLLSRLLTLHQVPKEIFIQGTLPKISIDQNGYATPRILTVVGSRKYSTYGKDVVKYLLGALSGADVIILSGLALGIDSLAHKIALENNIVTLSIPGSGLGSGVLYPRSNVRLAEEILSSGGSILSEYDDTTKAEQWTFPARNRLMAALSDAVLLIEAEASSGTLITARHALELGKDIGIVPGSIFSPTSRGTHALLKDGATPISTTNDLYELLHLAPKEEKRVAIKNLNNDETTIYALLHEPCNKDTLLASSLLSPQNFMIALTTLEMKGYIQETFGEVRRIV